MMSGALWATEEQTETLTKREKRVDGAPVRVCPVGVMKTGAQYGQLKNKLAETRKFGPLKYTKSHERSGLVCFFTEGNEENKAVSVKRSWVKNTWGREAGWF